MKSEEFNSSSVIYTTHKRNRKHSYREQQALYGLLLFCFTLEWCIKILHERKIESGYGDSVVRRLSADLKERYPKMGVSPHQLWNMMKFYERYAGHDEKVLRSVALLPWSHNLLLLSKGLNDEATL